MYYKKVSAGFAPGIADSRDWNNFKRNEEIRLWKRNPTVENYGAMVFMKLKLYAVEITPEIEVYGGEEEAGQQTQGPRDPAGPATEEGCGSGVGEGLLCPERRGLRFAHLARLHQLERLVARRAPSRARLVRRPHHERVVQRRHVRVVRVAAAHPRGHPTVEGSTGSRWRAHTHTQAHV